MHCAIPCLAADAVLLRLQRDIYLIHQTGESNLAWRCSQRPLTPSIWNFAPADTLVVITANVPPVSGMRVDMHVVDGSEHGRIYQSKNVSSPSDFSDGRT